MCTIGSVQTIDVYKHTRANTVSRCPIEIAEKLQQPRYLRPSSFGKALMLSRSPDLIAQGVGHLNQSVICRRWHGPQQRSCSLCRIQTKPHFSPNRPQEGFPNRKWTHKINLTRTYPCKGDVVHGQKSYGFVGEGTYNSKVEKLQFQCIKI